MAKAKAKINAGRDIEYRGWVVAKLARDYCDTLDLSEYCGPYGTESEAYHAMRDVQTRERGAYFCIAKISVPFHP